ncbi:unnamed protein product [Phytophthora lilii]|uniref:Unnamed protein product n=1 Tax=Phytophthora lilii TaxID=2077276 RepID=A0A9W6YIR2_9STRA|nr:unnamed protein product [Phytophthora lilii]
MMRLQHENVVVLDLESELIQLGMTRIRDYENAGKLSEVLHTSLPYDSKYGEILVQEAAKGGNKNGHIVPGIGAFEERYLGAPSSVVELADDPAVDGGNDENALKAKITQKLSSWSSTRCCHWQQRQPATNLLDATTRVEGFEQPALSLTAAEPGARESSQHALCRTSVFKPKLWVGVVSASISRTDQLTEPKHMSRP